jgi:thiamine phosphate synthase YjbQ (UPF0047 family)
MTTQGLSIQEALEQLPEDVLEFLLGALKVEEQRTHNYESTNTTDAQS